MSEQVMPFVGGQPDYLSLVNAEVEKVEPIIKVSLTPPDEQPPSLVSSESLPTPTERSKEVQHLKASNFTEPTLPIDWLSQSVQDYIRTVAESYGCPQDFVVSICLTTAGIAAGKKVLLATNPYTNYPWPSIPRRRLFMTKTNGRIGTLVVNNRYSTNEWLAIVPQSLVTHCWRTKRHDYHCCR